MQTFHTLESKSYVAGGNVQVSLRDLPPGKRLKALMLRLEATWTQASSSSVAVNGDDLVNVFANIEVGKRIKGTGKYFSRLNWLMSGGQLNFPASVPATDSGVFRRTPTVIVPFSDFGAISPLDAAPLTEFFRDTPLVIDFLAAGSATLGATLTPAGTLRTVAILEDAEVGVVPSAVQMGYIDWAGQTVMLEPGLYTHAFLYKDTAGTDSYTSLEISSVSMTVDGERIFDVLRAEELASIDDFFWQKGSALLAESATAPVGGEQLTTEPSVSSAAAATVTLEYVPLVIPPARYKFSQCIEVRKNMRLDFQGTNTSFRIGYRKIEPRSIDDAVKAAAKSGVQAPDASQMTAKTFSKSPLSPEKAWLLSYLPLRHK